MKTRTSRYSSLTAALLMAFAAAPAIAQTFTWDGGADTVGAWNAQANWDPNVNPTYGNTTDIVFGNSVNTTLTYLAGSRTLRSLSFSENVDSAVNIWLNSTSASTSSGTIMTFSSDTGESNITVAAGATGSIVIRSGQSAGRIELNNPIVVNHNGSGTLNIRGMRDFDNATTLRRFDDTYSVTKRGTGLVTYQKGSTANYYYKGGTLIEGGEFRLTAAGVLHTEGPVGIGNGTLGTGNFSHTVGTLDVTGAATINLGGTSAAVAFADSSAVDWTGGTLAITGSFVSGTSLRFGTTANGLTATQLAQISATGLDSFSLDENGYLLAQASTKATVTINQATTQADPTSSTTINFTVVFNKAVTGFANADVTLSGTAGATTAEVTESAPNNGTTYNVAVSGMTGNGTVIASIAADVVDGGNFASTSTDNTVTYSDLAVVAINQAASQFDPAALSPINFTAVFSKPVTGFENADVTLSGTAGATTAVVTEIAPNDGTTYNVAVSGMASDGTVIASIAANVVVEGNFASTSTDNSVTYNTAANPIVWDGSETGDWGTAGNWDTNVVPNSRSVDGVFYASGAGNLATFLGSSGKTLRSLTFNADADADVTIRMDNNDTIGRQLTFESNTGTSTITVDAGATANVIITTTTVGGRAQMNNNLVIDHNGSGTLTIRRIRENSGNNYSLTKTGTGTLVYGNTAAYYYDGPTIINGGIFRFADSDALSTGPVSIGTATLDAATFDDTVGTLDITGAATINLGTGATLAFADSSAVDWTGGTLAITGTFVSGTSLRFGTNANGLTAGQLAQISVPGIETLALNDSGFLINGAVAKPTVTINQKDGQADPTTASPIEFTVVFSTAVTGFATGDVTLGGTAGATTAVVSGSGTTYNVAVSGMTGNGTVTASIAADVVDGGNDASTSTDNEVSYTLPVTGFALWQQVNETEGGLDADHDGDGVTNGVEYFLGGGTDTTGPTALPAVVNTAGVLSITWTKAADYTGAYGTDFRVETSDTLAGGWTAETVGGTVAVSGNNVTYTFPAPLGARKFVRLAVTGP